MLVFTSPATLTAVDTCFSNPQPAADVDYMLRTAAQPIVKKYAFKATCSEGQEPQAVNEHTVWQQPVGKQTIRAGTVPRPCSSTLSGPSFKFAALAADADGGHSAEPVSEETGMQDMQSAAEIAVQTDPQEEFDLQILEHLAIMAVQSGCELTVDWGDLQCIAAHTLEPMVSHNAIFSAQDKHQRYGQSTTSSDGEQSLGDGAYEQLPPLPRNKQSEELLTTVSQLRTQASGSKAKKTEEVVSAFDELMASVSDCSFYESDEQYQPSDVSDSGNESDYPGSLLMVSYDEHEELYEMICRKTSYFISAESEDDARRKFTQMWDDE